MKVASRPSVRWPILAALVLGALAAGWQWLAPRLAKTDRELTRDALDLRDGVLYVRGEARPFEGRMVEDYRPGARKLAIDVKHGKPHGRSLGWYPDGQMEVEERFAAGRSHGPRTRWHPNGTRKCLAQIEHGEVVGEYVEWHDNGQLSLRMTLRDGQPDGQVGAWHPSGALKSRVRFADGKQVGREFWPDPALAVAVAPAKSE